MFLHSHVTIKNNTQLARFITLLHGLMFTFPTVISILPTLLNCCFVPSNITSDFVSFNLSKFDCIQDLISAIQLLISSIEVLESLTEKDVCRQHRNGISYHVSLLFHPVVEYRC